VHEAAKVRVDVNQNQKGNIHVVYEDARQVMNKLLGPNPKDLDGIRQEQSPMLDVRAFPEKPS
jgi:hypothetical protein